MTEPGRIFRRAFLALGGALLLAGCGKVASSGADYASSEPAPAPLMKAAPEAPPSGGLADLSLSSAVPDASRTEAEADDTTTPPEVRTRKLIRSATLQIRVADTSIAEKTLLAALAARNGYVASSRAYEDSRSYTLRVPAAAFDDLLGSLGTLGKVLSRSESAEDVTLKFYDLGGRLETKKALLATFRSYLGKAKTIDEMMTVESRIAELQQEIEWLGTELKTLADLSDFSVIELELLPFSTVSYAEPTLLERLGALFRAFGGYLTGIAVILVGGVIYGVPAILLLAVLYWLLLGHVGLLRKLWKLIARPRPPRP